MVDLFAPSLASPRQMPALRPYQQRGVEQVRAMFAAGFRRVLYQAPTGSGKTVLFSHIVAGAAAKGNRVMLLGHRQEIVEQISGALEGLGVYHGVIMAGEMGNDAPVQVASVATLVRRLNWMRDVDLVVVDEAHHAVAGTWKRILAASAGAKVLGVTATPERLDGKGLEDEFDVLVPGPAVGDLIKGGYLSVPVTYAQQRAPDLSRVKKSMGDYATGELSKAMSDGVVIGSAVDEYERRCRGVPAIAFCVDIAHSEMVCGAFKARGFRAAHVDGETPKDQRREMIAALGNGGLDVLCNCGLVSEGLDVPGVVAGILLRPTKSLALYLQQVGRTLRVAPGKKNAIILDHAGNLFEHGFVDDTRSWTLKGREKRKREVDAAPFKHCPECGAALKLAAKECDACGADLRKQYEEVARALELSDWIRESTVRVRGMSYPQCLEWAGADEVKLRLVAQVRGYKSGWVWHQLNDIKRGHREGGRRDPLLDRLHKHHARPEMAGGNQGY